MKIIFYRHALLSRGGDKMFLFYANGLAEAGHHVTLYCNTSASVFPLSAKLHRRQIPWPGKIGTILFALLHNFGGDALLVADIIPLAVALSLRNRRLVYFAQDLDTSYYTSPLLIGLMRFLLRLGVGKRKIPTIAVAESLAGELQKLTGNTVQVIRNGIDQTVFYREPDAELVASKKGKKALLLHARTDHRKGFDLACQVVRTLTTEGPANIVVWTVGEQTSGIFGEIEHRDFGYVEEGQLRQIMSSADIFLYPSRHEGMPLMPLEAMACGCAVVTTKAVPGLEHQTNALVYDIDDIQGLTEGARSLIADAELSQRLTTQACQLVAKSDMRGNLADFSSFLRC
ncbi:MAG: glycosyltransferase family 4 protein [Desulfurivibrionaceae bacterium]